jgi:hypothetical protein
LRSSMSRSRERLDTYTLQLQQHGLDSVEREVSWLRELIDNESENKSGGGASAASDPGHGQPAHR